MTELKKLKKHIEKKEVFYIKYGRGAVIVTLEKETFSDELNCEIQHEMECGRFSCDESEIEEQATKAAYMTLYNTMPFDLKKHAEILHNFNNMKLRLVKDLNITCDNRVVVKICQDNPHHIIFEGKKGAIITQIIDMPLSQVTFEHFSIENPAE